MIEILSHKDVQERLIEAWGFMMRLPDRERGWHSVRSAWPEIRKTLRDGDMKDYDEAPRAGGLSVREIDRLNQTIMGEGSWMGHVSEVDRKLVAIVLAMKHHVAAGGFEWADVLARCKRAKVYGTEKATIDAVRMRYSRALRKICEGVNGDK